MDRREFLQKSLLGLIGATAGGTILSSVAEAATKAPARGGAKKIGLQLYSLREDMGADPAGTLKKIADIGYTELETAANYKDGLIYGYKPAELRKMVEGLGMHVSSCHLTPGGISVLEKPDEAVAWWDKAFDDYSAAGCRYAVQSSIKAPETLDDLKKHCEYFDRVGEMAAKKGLRFGYHNHARELNKIDGQTVYDYYLDHTSPKNVFLEMDVYWIMKGGGSPVEYLQKYAGRFPVLHIKDESIIGESGELDFKSIFKAAYAQGMKDYYVEIERYTQPAEICAERSYDYLLAADFVK